MARILHGLPSIHARLTAREWLDLSRASRWQILLNKISRMMRYDSCALRGSGGLVRLISCCCCFWLPHV